MKRMMKSVVLLVLVLCGGVASADTLGDLLISVTIKEAEVAELQVTNTQMRANYNWVVNNYFSEDPEEIAALVTMGACLDEQDVFLGDAGNTLMCARESIENAENCLGIDDFDGAAYWTRIAVLQLAEADGQIADAETLEGLISSAYAVAFPFA